MEKGVCTKCGNYRAEKNGLCGTCLLLMDAPERTPAASRAKPKGKSRAKPKGKTGAKPEHPGSTSS